MRIQWDHTWTQPVCAHTHTHTHTHTHKANTLCMEFHNGRSSFPNLHFQGQAASGALVDCVSKVWWNHTSLTSRYCTLLSNQTLCLTNIRKQPAGNIKMTQWARTSAGNIIRDVEAVRAHRRTHRRTHTHTCACTFASQYVWISPAL